MFVGNASYIMMYKQIQVFYRGHCRKGIGSQGKNQGDKLTMMCHIVLDLYIIYLKLKYRNIKGIVSQEKKPARLVDNTVSHSKKVKY